MNQLLQQQGAEQPPDIDLFLHPDYWKGHMIGQPVSETLVGEHIGLRADKFALTTLAAYIALRAESHPLDTYRVDELFSCDRYLPGTIVSYTEESLTTTNHLTVENVRTRSEKIVAKSEKYKPPVLPPTGRIDIKDEDVHFRRADHYGVIVGRKKGRNSLLSIIATGVDIGPDGKVRFQYPILIPHPTTMKVGSPQHHRLPQSGREQLQRSTIVQVLLEGEPKKNFVPRLRHRSVATSRPLSVTM